MEKESHLTQVREQNVENKTRMEDFIMLDKSTIKQKRSNKQRCSLE